MKIQVTESSTTPLIDGYISTSPEGWPFHIHPEATPKEWAELQEQIAAGNVDIAPYKAPPGPTEKELKQQQIAELEATITPRRIREALLGVDGGWLHTINAQIESLR